MNKTLSRFASIAAVSTVAGAGAIAAAAPAQAYESVWDRLAACESDNVWDINTGNGFYGGVQFTIGTWNEFGGRQFASRADRATKVEQITVAKRVLAVQGPGAWPVCSKYAGLTKSNGGAIYNWESAAPVTESRASEPVEVKAPVAEQKAAAEEQTAAKRTYVAKVVAKKTRVAKSDVVKKKAVKKAQAGKDVYVVKPGDSLTGIAQRLGISDWTTIYNLNKAQIADPDLIYVGQRFILD